MSNLSEARHYLEDFLVELLKAGDLSATHPRFPEGLQLGVEVLPGRSSIKRPPNYVAISGDNQDPRHAENGVWMINVTIWSVLQTDETNATALSKSRIAKIVQWLGPGCPARRTGNANIFVHGLRVTEVSEVKREYTFADVVQVRFAVREY